MTSQMKATFGVAVLLATFTGHTEDIRVTVSLKGLLLSQATNELGIQAGLTFGLPPKLGWRVGPDITLKNVPAEMALQVLAAAYQVCLVRTPQVIHVQSCEAREQETRYL